MTGQEADSHLVDMESEPDDEQLLLFFIVTNLAMFLSSQNSIPDILRIIYPYPVHRLAHLQVSGACPSTPMDSLKVLLHTLVTELMVDNVLPGYKLKTLLHYIKRAIRDFTLI